MSLRRYLALLFAAIVVLAIGGTAFASIPGEPYVMSVNLKR
jgi:hypothetical protein